MSLASFWSGMGGCYGGKVLAGSSHKDVDGFAVDTTGSPKEANIRSPTPMPLKPGGGQLDDRRQADSDAAEQRGCSRQIGSDVGEQSPPKQDCPTCLLLLKDGDMKPTTHLHMWPPPGLLAPLRIGRPPTCSGCAVVVGQSAGALSDLIIAGPAVRGKFSALWLANNRDDEAAMVLLSLLSLHVHYAMHVDSPPDSSTRSTRQLDASSWRPTCEPLFLVSSVGLGWPSLYAKRDAVGSVRVGDEKRCHTSLFLFTSLARSQEADGRRLTGLKLLDEAWAAAFEDTFPSFCQTQAKGKQRDRPKWYSRGRSGQTPCRRRRLFARS